MKSLGAKNILKNLTVFFLGMSCILFAVQAFNITPDANNAIMFIKTIFLTSSGSNTSATGIILEGLGGNAWFKGDVTVNSLANVSVIGTDGSGKLTQSSAQGIYNYISGYVAGGAGGGTSLWAQATGANNIYNKNYVTGFVGIGLTGPTQPLQVLGNIVAGAITNTVNGTYGSIVGGANSNIYGDYHFIGGGQYNNIFGNVKPSTHSSIVGGQHNAIYLGNSIFIGGGVANTIGLSGGLSNVLSSSIVGGDRNNINQTTNQSFIGGGYSNSITGSDSTYSSIVGGSTNSIEGVGHFIGGGRRNAVGVGRSTIYSSIVGGEDNVISAGTDEFIGGGASNSIYNPNYPDNGYSSIVGGNKNTINQGFANIILGGMENHILAKDATRYSTIAGGYGNIINEDAFAGFIAGGYNNGIYSGASSSFVGGSGARVNHSNTFLRNSDSTVIFPSGRSNTFIINAPFEGKTPPVHGGVGINTSNPQADLDVLGSVIVSKDITSNTLNVINGISSDYLNVTHNIQGDALIVTNSIRADGYGAMSGGTLHYGTSTVVKVMGIDSLPCDMNFVDGLLVSHTCP